MNLLKSLVQTVALVWSYYWDKRCLFSPFHSCSLNTHTLTLTHTHMHTPTHLSFLSTLYVLRINGVIQESEVLALLRLTLPVLGPSHADQTQEKKVRLLVCLVICWSNLKLEWLLFITYWKVVLLDRAVVYFGRRILNSPGRTLVAFGINKEGKNQCSYRWLSLALKGGFYSNLLQACW